MGVMYLIGGVFVVFELFLGLGVCVDSFGYVGYKISVVFDLLLVKVIVYMLGYVWYDVVVKGVCVLCEFCIDGVVINIGFL